MIFGRFAVRKEHKGRLWAGNLVFNSDFLEKFRIPRYWWIYHLFCISLKKKEIRRMIEKIYSDGLIVKVSKWLFLLAHKRNSHEIPFILSALLITQIFFIFFQIPVAPRVLKWVKETVTNILPSLENRSPHQSPEPQMTMSLPPKLPHQSFCPCHPLPHKLPQLGLQCPPCGTGRPNLCLGVQDGTCPFVVIQCQLRILARGKILYDVISCLSTRFNFCSISTN